MTDKELERLEKMTRPLDEAGWGTIDPNKIIVCLRHSLFETCREIRRLRGDSPDPKCVCGHPKDFHAGSLLAVACTVFGCSCRRYKFV